MREYNYEAPTVWITKENQKLKLKLLEICDQHLIHIIRLCKRRRAEFLDQAIASECYVNVTAVHTEMSKQINEFILKAQRRKLPVT